MKTSAEKLSIRLPHMKISVIGTGYLGATHAACMAELGLEVVGVDNDAAKIEALSRGELPFYEPELPELLSKHVKNGKLKFTTDYSEIVDCDVHFICVGTPQIKGGLAADLSYVKSAFAAVGAVAKPGSLLVGKSAGGQQENQDRQPTGFVLDEG